MTEECKHRFGGNYCMDCGISFQEANQIWNVINDKVERLEKIQVRPGNIPIKYIEVRREWVGYIKYKGRKVPVMTNPSFNKETAKHTVYSVSQDVQK